ncbi:MAG: hypothetical protein HYY93_12445 [Planctomycetes bacterium]|nr:hypothetical protein [Planctomycetota bacterium]
MIPKVGTRVDPRDVDRDTLTVEEAPNPAKKEREFYEAFLSMRKQEPKILEQSAEEVLQSTEPDCKKVALLRALCDTKSESAVDHLAFAVASLTEGAVAGHESVPSFALRLLTERSVSDAKSRAALEQLLWGGTTLASDRRSRAAAALYANASADELYRLTPFLSGERDPAVLASSAAGLAANTADPSWAKRVIDSLDLPPPASEPAPAPGE